MCLCENGTKIYDFLKGLVQMSQSEQYCVNDEKYIRLKTTPIWALNRCMQIIHEIKN
jgi:hypothetical protein